MLICLSLVLYQTFLWGQIAVQFFVATAAIIVLQWYKPLSTLHANKIETFNEVITMFMLYGMMNFSDY